MLNNRNIFFMKDGNDKINITKNLSDNILKKNIIKNDIYNNILFESFSINNSNTNYNNCIIYTNDFAQNPLSNYKMIKNNLLNKKKDVKNKKLFLSFQNGYLIYTANCGHLLTHNVYDIFPQLNFIYYRAKNNPDDSILIEIISKTPEGYDITYNSDSEINNNIQNIKKIIQYLRDLDFNNYIIIISNKIFLQFYLNKYDTIDKLKNWTGNLFVKNLNVLNLYNNNIDYIPLLCRYVPNLEFNEVYNTTLYKFFEQKYTKNNKKNLILEKRIRNSKGEGRGFLMNDYKLIYDYCINYCAINNLNFILWDENYINKSILEQQLISYNSDIIISIGGSFNLFNLGHSCSKIIILEFWPSFRKSWIIDSWLNIFSEHCSNGSKVYLYIPYLSMYKNYNKPVAINYFNIIVDIFNNNIENYLIKV